MLREVSIDGHQKTEALRLVITRDCMLHRLGSRLPLGTVSRGASEAVPGLPTHQTE